MNRLKALRPQHKEKSFAGVHVLFCGDFQQLPPVLASSLIDPDLTNEKNDIRCTIGKDLFFDSNSSFLLRGNYRFREDPEYGKLLERIHEGTSTEADRKTINSRCIHKLRDQNIDYTQYEYLVPTVQEKNGHNEKVFLEAAAQRRDQHTLLRIRSSLHSKVTALSREDEEFIRTTYTDFRKFEDHQPVLDVYKGMPLLVIRKPLLESIRWEMVLYSALQGRQWHKSLVRFC